MPGTKLNVYAMAERFEVHASTICRWKYQGIVPKPKKLGGRVFWLKNEIDRWEADGYPRSQPQMEQIEQ